MSAFKDRLLKFYENNPQFVIPATRMRDVLQQVTANLEDLSISRPVERLRWGVPVPDDESQTIYVWLDALINYLTKSNYPFQIPGREDAAGWPADCHVIGKDIVRYDQSPSNIIHANHAKLPLHLLACIPHGSRPASTPPNPHPRPLDPRPRENVKVHRQRRQPVLRPRSLRRRYYAVLPRTRRRHQRRCRL